MFLSRKNSVTLPVGIVCYRYADFLHHTLAQTLRHFSNVTVITAKQDRDTVSLTQAMGGKVLLSDIWFQEGAAFNKSAALNQWLSLQPMSWVLVLDADIYLPDNFEVRIEDLDPQSLYSIPRRICDLEWDWVCPASQRPDFPLAIPPVRNGMVWRRPTSQPAALSGYFHLWNRGISGRPFFPASMNAAEYDVEFALQFPERQRHFLPGDVIHLGPVKQNWSGRVSPPWTLIPERSALLPSYLLPYGADRIYRFNLGSRNPTYLCTSPSHAWVYRTVPTGFDWQVAKEIYIKQTLKDVPTPKVLFVSDTAYTMEYGGRTAQVIPNLPESFFASCGITLRRLHNEKLDVSRLCQNRYADADWDSMFGYNFRISQCARWLKRIPLDSPLHPWLTKLLERMVNDSDIQDVFRSSRFCFTHGDYKTGNLLTDGLQVTNVIDFEHSIYGDPDSDLHMFCQRILKEGYPVEVMRTFLAAYGVTDTFHKKRHFYRYFSAFLRSVLRPLKRHDHELVNWVRAIHDDSDPYLQCNLV